MSAELASIIVASIAAGGGVLAAIISAIHRRETRSDHDNVGAMLRELAAKVEVWHATNRDEHGVIRDDLTGLRSDFTAHVDRG